MKPIYKCVVCGVFTEESFHCNRPARLLLSGEQRLRLSKLMSFLLRHGANEVGLALSENGWVSVRELARAIRERWRSREYYSWLQEEHIIAVSLLDPKGRFELSSDRKMIRASYGHTIRVSLGYKPLKPTELPRVLYHGTLRENIPSILERGILPMRRIFVHLTPSIDVALEVGLRHGRDVVILVIEPSCLLKKGLSVYKASNIIYLTKHVPPSCIREVLGKDRVSRQWSR
ncbi:MAG: RNA 2'-phosphotransferase [Hyperthermus sp.]|nr:MAG: RNA 2'-phosphotransferase [Hyperthermus sp.]